MKRTAAFLCTLMLLPAAPNVASVKFTVLNRWGKFHDYKVLHFRMNPASPDLAVSFSGLGAAKVPYGIYDYELVPVPGDPSLERISGTVDVNRDQIHITSVLETPDSIGHRAQLRVSGTIEPRPKGEEPVWVAVQNVYGRYREESTVDERGSFQLHHIWGNNVILVCAGSKVLMLALLNIGPQESMNYVHVDLRTGTVKTELR
jgi:hypothetical protein